MCWLFCVSLLFFTFATSDSTLLDKLSKIKWHCADENCSVPISEGYGLRLYNGDDPLKLNFNENDDFLILGKTNSKLDNYWLVQAGDRKGIVPVQFVKERKVIINRANQIVTELDLNSIIKPVESERSTIKETIKPSSPSLVVDGTTLPPYEDDSYSTEVVVEDDSEELYDESSKPPENPSYFEAFNSSPSPVNDSPGTDNNQTTNHPEVGEGIVSDKVANIVSYNVYENETSTTQNISGNEISQDMANDKVEAVPAGNIIEDSNNQNFTSSNNDMNRIPSNDNNVDSAVNNVIETVGIKTAESTDERKLDNLKFEKSNPESETTNTQNVHTFTEPVPTVVTQLVNDDYSSNAEQQGISEKEDNIAPELIPNTDAYVNVPLTAIPMPESPVSSTMTADAKEDLGVSQIDAGNHHPLSAEPNLATVPEMVNPAYEDATVALAESGSEMKTFSPLLKTDLPSDKEKIEEDVIVPSSDSVKLNVDPVPPPSASLFSSYDQSVESNQPSDTVVPPPTGSPSIEQYPDMKPVTSPESPPSAMPASSSPVSDTTPLHLSPEIPSTLSYTINNNEYSHSDTVNFESLPNEGVSNPITEKPVSYVVEDTAGSFTEPPALDQQPANQPFPEESVTETLPADKSVKESNDVEDDSKPSPQLDDLADVIQEGDGWFSSISSIMGSFTEMFSKSDIGVERVEEVIPTASEEIEASTEKSVSQRLNDEVKYCEKESCSQQQQSKDNVADDGESKNDGAGGAYVAEMLGFSFPESQMSFSTFLCMVITSFVVLLFSLGYYYLENLKQDTSLIEKINTVSSELFFTQKELASIEEQYQLANENYRRLVSETSHNETALEELRKELEESKAARGVLEDEIKRLEKEIESLVEEGDEMHRMLAESFSEEERTKSLLANISDLKSVLSDRLQEIVSLTEQLDKEKQEVELLTISLKKSEEKREATEDKLTKVLIDADSKTLAVTKEFEEKVTTLERIIEERSLERANFEKQLCELKGTCESLMVQKELAEKELKKAHGVSSGKALNEWLEAKNMRTELLTVQKEVEKLREALEEANNRGTLLEEKEKQLLNEIEDLNNKYESAEKDKIEALTKLQVLSNYFKEKEIQLQEELGIKESQWLQKQSEDHTIYEQMRSLREENLSYKAQNEALKKEIIDQEASFKIQIANEEQKAQENWINLRHTERRLKEVQMEAAHLRSRLTALEANPDSLDDKHKSLEMNGDVSMGAASPPFMLYPPPDYIPPPPLVSPTRPPPLGRLSSPPLTPPAPLSPFEFYPPPPPSPPPPLRVHKPQPREPHRKQKDSQSSNHSSESTEKPVRRGKR